VAGGWRRLHNEELHTLSDSQNIIRVIMSWNMRWTGNAKRIEEEDNIRMNLRETGCKGLNCMHLDQDRDKKRALWALQWTFGFHKRRGIPCLAEWLSASEDGFRVMELVFIFSPNTLSSSGQTRGWCVPLNSSPSWWHILEQSWKAMALKHLLVSGNSKQEIHQRHSYLCRLYNMFCFNLPD